MPTYAYACTSCAHRFDAVQSFSEPSLSVCPECGGTLRKEYGSIGVTFNGSGFYRTDSRAAKDGKGGDGKRSGDGKGDAAASSSPGTGASAPSSPSKAAASAPSSS
jgi:putative FmdB family regulatory protein